jgi:protein ImuB
MRDVRRANANSYRRNASQSEPSTCAVLVVASERGKQWVACACDRAEARGVRAGMSLAHARALLQGAHVWERPFTPSGDTQRLERLARWAQRFSPVVAADEPDGLLLDMAGCERLFGKDEQVVRRIDAAFAQLGLQTRLALAPTVGCAWAVSRFAAERVRVIELEHVRDELAPLPIAGLRIDPIFVGALHEVGIERIGSLFELPREELACRFGADLLRRLDQATGEAVETITPLRPAMPLEATRLFDGPITSLEAMVLTVRELLFSLVLQLEQRACGVRTLDVVMKRVAAEPCRVSITLTYPSCDVRHLWTLLGPKLERINLGYGVESITLSAARIGRMSARQGCFDHGERQSGNQADEAALGELLDRLTDRFGRRAVCAMAVVESHVPEVAFPLRALTSVGSKLISDEKWASPAHPFVAQSLRRFVALSCLERPSQLFERPEPAQVISLTPDGPPSWMRWRGRECTVLRGLGPERIALPWWTSERGESPAPNAVRDYYEVQDDQGRLLWVFRDRATSGWFVHGQWA